MDRHPTDFVRLLFGLAFLATGAGFIVHEASGRALDPEWIMAVAFVTIGVAFLAATLLHLPGRDRGSDARIADGGERQFVTVAGRPDLAFDNSAPDALGADNELHGHADEIGVGELHTGTHVAVVEQHVDPEGA